MFPLPIDLEVSGAGRKARWLGLAALTGGAYYLWQREQQRMAQVPPLQAERAQALVARALPFLRLPTSPDAEPELAFDTNGDGKFIGLRCPVTHRLYLYRDRVLDLLDREPPLTPTQNSLNTPLRSWAYDHARSVVRVLGLPPFPQEAEAIARNLQLGAGDTVLDLCCGPGNFTTEWARRVGPQGLVLGLDLSRAMLARAAYHVHLAGSEAEDNVLLIRGDALRLPLRDGGLQRLNCSGGLHQLPDLDQALGEMARVSAPGATLTLSTFATDLRAGPGPAAAAGATARDWLRSHLGLHLVDLGALGDKLQALGFTDYQATLPGWWFGYAHARR